MTYTNPNTRSTVSTTLLFIIILPVIYVLLICAAVPERIGEIRDKRRTLKQS